MENPRQKKISKVLQKDVAEIIQENLKKQGTRGVLVSVTKVDVSADFSSAKVFLSVFPSAMAQQILKDTNREEREEIYHKIQERRFQDEKALDDLYDELIILRQKIAKNASFQNYRDYMFSAMGRFDYTATDCYSFHDAIAQEIAPIISLFEEKRKKKLNYTEYRPWDTSVDVDGLPALKPFKGEEELTNLSIDCFNKLRPYFGECIATMKEMKHLDLESKKGKAPGGFMYPLYEIGVPFIYMNSVGSQRDVVTMVHEGGHAVHSFLSRDLTLTEFKSTPSEVAELASMSMELFSMEHWDVFYENENDLKRAKLEQLEKALGTLPWVAAIDKFQHWIYTTEHTAVERKEKWLEIDRELGNQIVNWEGEERSHAIMWQRQLHLYEVPFYYIEYGMAQLGAIAMWREFILKGEEALNNYMEALKLGYTKSIGEIYETAGIKFNFSASYVKELADFVKEELSKIN